MIETLLAVSLSTACRSVPEVDPRYRPAENVLEVIAVLRAHVPDDTYRFAAGPIRAMAWRPFSTSFWESSVAE